MRRADGTIQICDFGLARYAKESGVISTTGGAGAAVGTACYMAPEQFLGDSITAAADVYAFGGIIYFMICGQHPWKEKLNYLQISTAVVSLKQTPALPPFVDHSSLPPGLVDLMTECFSHDPLSRPTSIEILEDLNGMTRVRVTTLYRAPNSFRLAKMYADFRPDAKTTADRALWATDCDSANPRAVCVNLSKF